MPPPKRGSESFRRIYAAAMSAYDRQDYRSAAELFASISDVDDVCSPLVCYYRAQVELQLGLDCLRRNQHKEAASHFSIAATLNPRNASLSRLLATSHAGAGRYDSAAAVLEPLTTGENEAVEDRIRLALSQWKDGQLFSAQSMLMQGQRHHGDNAEISFQLGTLLAATEQYEDAIDAFNQALDRASDHVDARVSLALCHAVRGEADEAFKHLTTAQNQRPNDARIGLFLSLATQSLAASGAQPKLQLVKPETALIGDQDSLQELSTVVVSEPDLIEAFLALPKDKAHTELFELMSAVLHLATKEHPHYADLHLLQCRVQERLGHNDDAITEAEAALNINPKYTSALIELARLYARTDRSHDAVARLEEALTYGAEYADVYYLLGNLYRTVGNIESARSAYERALDLNEDYIAARKALDVLAA